MNDFYTFKEFPIPSIWKEASGGNHGYVAIDKKKNEDIIVVSLKNGIATGEVRTIDYFKIQYRYYQIDHNGQEVIYERENKTTVDNQAGTQEVP